MKSYQTHLLIVSLLAFAPASIPLSAAEPPANALVVAEKILHEVNFEELDVASRWTPVLGSWTVADGSLVGCEMPNEHHTAIARFLRQTESFPEHLLLNANFRLNGAQGVRFDLKDKRVHVLEINCTAAGYTLRTWEDETNIALRGKSDEAIAPNEWHHLTAEISGNEVLIRIDGKRELRVKHPKIARDKSNLIVSIQSGPARVDNLKLEAASPVVSAIQPSAAIDLLKQSRDAFVFNLNPGKAVNSDRTAEDVFQTDGGGKLLITGETWGYIRTKERYQNYHLVLEYQFTGPTSGSRAAKARDSGLLLHCFGTDGSRGDGTWIPFTEVQIMEGATGDFIVLGPYDDQKNLLPIHLESTGVFDDRVPFYDPKGEPRIMPKKVLETMPSAMRFAAGSIGR